MTGETVFGYQEALEQRFLIEGYRADIKTPDLGAYRDSITMPLG